MLRDTSTASTSSRSTGIVLVALGVGVAGVCAIAGPANASSATTAQIVTPARQARMYVARVAIARSAHYLGLAAGSARAIALQSSAAMTDDRGIHGGDQRDEAGQVGRHHPPGDSQGR